MTERDREGRRSQEEQGKSRPPKPRLPLMLPSHESGLSPRCVLTCNPHSAHCSNHSEHLKMHRLRMQIVKCFTIYSGSINVHPLHSVLHCINVLQGIRDCACEFWRRSTKDWRLQAAVNSLRLGSGDFSFCAAAHSR